MLTIFSRLLSVNETNERQRCKILCSNLFFFLCVNRSIFSLPQHVYVMFLFKKKNHSHLDTYFLYIYTIYVFRSKCDSEMIVLKRHVCTLLYIIRFYEGGGGVMARLLQPASILHTYYIDINLISNETELWNFCLLWIFFSLFRSGVYLNNICF